MPQSDFKMKVFKNFQRFFENTKQKQTHNFLYFKENREDKMQK